MTRRTLFSLLVFTVLAAWASAQNASDGLTAADQLKMLKANRPLIEDLVRHGLALSAVNTPLDRAEEARQAAERISDELREAARTGDADRFAELGPHVETLLAEGCLPNLREAGKTIPPQSEGFERYRETHKKVRDGLSRSLNAIPTDGEISKSKSGQVVREKLKGLLDSLPELKGER